MWMEPKYVKIIPSQWNKMLENIRIKSTDTIYIIYRAQSRRAGQIPSESKSACLDAFASYYVV